MNDNTQQQPPAGRATAFARVRDRSANPTVIAAALSIAGVALLGSILWIVILKGHASAAQTGTGYATNTGTAESSGAGLGNGLTQPTQPFVLPRVEDTPGPAASASGTYSQNRTIAANGTAPCDPRFPLSAACTSASATPTPIPTITPPVPPAGTGGGARSPSNGGATTPPIDPKSLSDQRIAAGATARPTAPPTPSDVAWADEPIVAPASAAEQASPAPAPAAAATAAPTLGGDSVGYRSMLTPTQIGVGTVITARLRTKVVSDLPGYACATITSPVYDSATGNIEVIPAGTDLCGAVTSKLMAGQNRLFIAWTVLRFPHTGREFDLGSQPAVDAQGASGLTGDTDLHRGSVYTDALLLTVVGAAEAAVAPQTGGSIVSSPNVGDQARSSAGQGINGVGNSLIQQGISRAPTIILRPPTIVNVLVTRDLPLERYETHTR